MRIIWGYFKERAWFALLLVLCVGLFAQVLRLYDLPAEAVGYASLLCAAAFAVWRACRASSNTTVSFFPERSRRMARS